MSENFPPTRARSAAPYNLALVRDALGQGGIDEGLKLAKGLRVGSREMPAGDGDIWVENSIRYSTCLSAAASGATLTAAASTTAWQVLPMNTVTWDTDEMLDLATYPNRITIKTGGVYHIFGAFTLGTDANGWRGISIFLNNTTRLVGSHRLPPAGTGMDMGVSCVWQLNEGDYLELYCAHSLAYVIGVFAPRISVARIA